MNSQDLRTLQEAYLEVYYELDEGRGDDLRTKHGLEPGEVSTRLSKRAERKALNIGGRTHFDRERRDSLLGLSGLSRTRSQGKTPAGNSRRNSKGQLRDIRSSGGRPSNIYDAGADRDRGNKGERFADFVSGKRDNPNMTDSERRSAHHNKLKEDIYDIILSHLLDEGYAETQEQAEVIMVNMSEDWRESIVEQASTVASSGGAGGKVTADKQYPATLRGLKGVKSTDSKGTEYFQPYTSSGRREPSGKPFEPTTMPDANRAQYKQSYSGKYENIPASQSTKNPQSHLFRTGVPRVRSATSTYGID